MEHHLQYTCKTYLTKISTVPVIIAFSTKLFPIITLSYRYKIFLSSSLVGPFEGIEDGNGYGEDHCELVGGSEDTAITKVYNYTYTYFSYGNIT